MWAIEVLQDMGFKYDSSIFPIRRSLYGIANANPCAHEMKDGFWEFPPATIRGPGMNLPIAGGGYLRLAPYWLISSAIRRSSGQRIRTFYFHPYELDPTDIQMKHKVKSLTSVLYWLQQKLGRGFNPDKLKKLLTEFQFTSVRKVLSNLQTHEME
jgi:hypothetical protein